MKLINEHKAIDTCLRQLIPEDEFENLSTAIEKLVREEAEGFAEWVSANDFYYSKKHKDWRYLFTDELVGTTSELFDLYKSEQLKTQQHGTDNV